jgi:hypothetical protein
MSGKSTTTTTTAVQITGAETEVDLSFGAEFHYDPADPLAVTMAIESISGAVHWTFARDLILNGRFEPTGDGDVHVWPCLDAKGAAVVIVELDAPAGRTMLQFSSRAVHDFIAASLATVPEGTEQPDVDAWIEQLLLDADSATN